MNRRLRQLTATAGLYVVSISVALGLCGLLVSATGGSARKVFTAFLDGSVRSPGSWGLTLTTAAPLLLVAVGSIVSTKAGLFNIGQEGQLILGAAAAAYVATRLDAPGPVVLSVSFLAAALIGGLWASIAAVMKFARQVPEVMSTLLMVWIAFQVTNFGLTKKWLLLSRAKVVSNINSGHPLPASARMPSVRIFGNNISWAVVVALIVAAVAAIVVARTTVGFRLRVLGLNASTARRCGVSAVVYGGGALIVSGLCAGLAGGLWLTSGVAGDRFTGAMSGNLGWQGLLVALLARDRGFVAIPMALVFASLRTGSLFLSATGVERRIADVVQAMLVLALLIPPAIQALPRIAARRGAS